MSLQAQWPNEWAAEAEQHNQGNNGQQGQINLSQSAAYPPSYPQERSHWSRENREMSLQAQWPNEWAAEESAWTSAGSQLAGPGLAATMAAQNAFLPQAQGNLGGYVVPNANSDGAGKFQQAWYPAQEDP